MTIAEVSKKYGLTADTLRYYERIGLLPPVNRNKSGNRDYSETDCGWIEFIKCMREAGLSIETLSEYITLFRQGNETLKARENLLIRERDKLKERLNAMQSTLERLNYKIERYQNGEMCSVTNED